MHFLKQNPDNDTRGLPIKKLQSLLLTVIMCFFFIQREVIMEKPSQDCSMVLEKQNILLFGLKNRLIQYFLDD